MLTLALILLRSHRLRRAGCAKTIEKKIAKMDGVKSATVDFDKKLAMVEYNVAKVTPVLLEETVTKVSDTYKVSDMKHSLE